MGNNIFYVVYLVPSDMSEDTAKTTTLATLAAEVRAWYAEEVGNNTAFTLPDPVVTIVDSPNDESYYSTGNVSAFDWGDKVIDDVDFTLGFNRGVTTDKYLCFCEADDGGVATSSFTPAAPYALAVLAQDYFANINNSQSDYLTALRSSIHETGHMLGFTHTPADDSIMDTADSQYLAKRPSAHHLRASDKTALQSDDFMSDRYAPQITKLPTLSNISSITI